MKKKITVLKELKSDILRQVELNKGKDSAYATGRNDSYSAILSLIEKLLSKEKEQIKFAFDQGQNGEFYSPEKYFNETFEQ